VRARRGVVTHERYTHWRLDVTDATAVAGMFTELKRTIVTLDVLINNAGVASMNAVALTPLDAARRVIETNFLAAFNFTREALRMMRKSSGGAGGQRHLGGGAAAARGRGSLRGVEERGRDLHAHRRP
jgi:NAD(P)-dependent dehydrogenase (short-subunit alcohol dehydrogenase family)